MLRLSHLSDNELFRYHTTYVAANLKSKRFESRKVHNCDLKFMYHVVRLLSEVEQILTTGDIDLQLNNEQLKAIRRGELTEGQIREWAAAKEKTLEEVYHTSTLQYSPDEVAIKTLLLHCLEAHYGSLDKCVVNPDAAIVALRNIRSEIEKVGEIL